jgi:peptide/nickel transport system permease protein
VTGFIVRRLLQAIVVVIGVTIFTFLLEHLIPGTVARAIVGPRATRGAILGFKREWGFNQPLPLQYFSFLD